MSLQSYIHKKILIICERHLPNCSCECTPLYCYCDMLKAKVTINFINMHLRMYCVCVFFIRNKTTRFSSQRSFKSNWRKNGISVRVETLTVSKQEIVFGKKFLFEPLPNSTYLTNLGYIFTIRTVNGPYKVNMDIKIICIDTNVKQSVISPRSVSVGSI